MTAGGGIDVDEVVRIVLRCPSVARVAPGTAVEVATYLPGRRVPGVRLVDGAVEVHVVAHYGRPLPAVADEVRRALASVVGEHRVDVFIDELDLDAAPALEAAAGSSA
ncbi:MAG TPA: hypothetical protein VGV93_06520 [Acidimicrobiales bacterium]|nr:hypothetical protein [Acidimicrobiales bacterium]